AAKDYLGAIEVYERVLQQDPDNERALAGTIASLRMDHRPDEAGPLAERAVAVYPKSVRLLYERGMVRFDQGKHDLALRDFKDALTLDPHQADALQWEVVASSDAHRVAGRFGPAHERLAAALRDPVLGHSPHILNQEGLVEYDQKLFRQAAEWFRRGLEEDPNNTFSIEWLCRAEAASLAAQGRFDDADTLFEQALVKLPDSPTLLAERASLHLDQAKIGVTGFDEAMGFLARALQRDPVQLRIRLERPRSMLEAVERRRLRAVANNVVQFLLAQKRLSDAIALLQAMIDAAPDDLPLVDTLGWA